MSTVEDRGTHSRQGSTSTQDRRASGNGRMPFEAIVEVGAHSVGGFEAESINLSPEGIRLRTAYLPELGDTLVCRFDGFGGEVMAEGQVIWRKPEARGGEFGVQFTRLDEYAVQVLESMCVSDEEVDPSEHPPSIRAALPGARVRVHIQGLGSPMRARVRDTDRGEVLIGSNLEFLRVGRDVELEDVEQGQSKTAQIEHVDVAIDPETNIPQLIVALRCDSEMFEAAPDSSELATAPIAVPVGLSAAPQQEITPGPTVIDRASSAEAAPAGEAYADDPGYTPAPEGEAGYTPYADDPQSEYDHTPYSAQGEAASATPAPVSSRSSELMAHASENDAAPTAQGGTNRFDGAKRRASELARKVSPAFSAVGSGAKGALGRILAKVKQKREQGKATRLSKERGNKPLRKTAPPPSGALRSDGKRLFRESHPSPPLSEPQAAPRADRKRAVFGVVLGVLAVVAIYLAATKVSTWVQDAPPASATKPAADGIDAEEAAAQRLAPPPPPAPGGVIATANVPLFGATPLSTTEPVPVPPDPNAAAESADAKEGTDEGASAKPAVVLEKEWGVGSINDASVLKLKMDGKIEGLSGSEGATGFTLIIPGRQSISSAAGLIRKDKRLESVNVVNYPDRVEVTVLFKKDVPAFRAKASGNRLIIELSADESKSSKKKSSKKKRSKSSKKKK